MGAAGSVGRGGAAGRGLMYVLGGIMESTTVRCPRCRKKQPEPCPERCGCGESLMKWLAPRRVVPAGQRSEAAGDTWPEEADGPEALSMLGGAHPPPTPPPPPEPLDNEW